VGECSWSAQERTDSTLLPPAETSVGSRVGYKKSLSLLAETIFRCDTTSLLSLLIITLGTTPVDAHLVVMLFFLAS
jgi:hypothetical protein